MIFREGEHLEVEVVGEIPEELSGGWVIRFPDESRSILEKKYYNGYPITVGQRLQGRIDKINCAGKVFFEPAHPCYVVGEEYLFSVISTKILKVNQFQITVKDCLGNFVEILSLKPHLEGSSVRLRVRNIRKGKVFLEFPDEPKIETEQFKTLVVSGTAKVDGVECYVLKDQDETEYHLPVRWYQHHGLAKGLKVECRIWFSESQNAVRIEPKHPCYSDNQLIEVNVVKRPSGFYSHDCFRKLIKIHGIDPEKEVPQVVTCRVLRIRKGKPVLMYEPKKD
ncbi:MAG TPA: hypothetical protein PK990_00415 [Salinivirgaceae bacterium]|nr:hypothetical protein [Salinivirgaceae bacterium]